MQSLRCQWCSIKNSTESMQLESAGRSFGREFHSRTICPSIGNGSWKRSQAHQSNEKQTQRDSKQKIKKEKRTLTRIQPFFLFFRFTLDIASNLTKKQFPRTDSLSRLVWKSSRKSCTVSRIWLSYSLVMFPRSQRTPFNNSLFIFFILLTFPPRRPSFPFLISSSTYFINIPSTTQLRIFGLLYSIYYTFFEMTFRVVDSRFSHEIVSAEGDI